MASEPPGADLPDPPPSATPAEPDEPPALTRTLHDAAAGNPAAWEQLVELYGRRVFALARSRLHDPHLAEEVVQSVFVSVLVALRRGGYAEQGRFESWLFRVAMNRIRDTVRQRGREAARAGARLDHACSAPTEPTSTPLPVPLADLRRAIAQLSDYDREVIELRHHAGLGFRQIADLLGQPLGTVLARHHRALRKLRTLLDQPGPHDA